MEQTKETKARTSHRRSGTAFVCRPRFPFREVAVSVGGADTEVLTLDIAANPQEDVHSVMVVPLVRKAAFG